MSDQIIPTPPAVLAGDDPYIKMVQVLHKICEPAGDDGLPVEQPPKPAKPPRSSPKFPYKFKHVSVFKRGADDDAPWIMAWKDPVERKRKFKTLTVDQLAAAKEAERKSKCVSDMLAGVYCPDDDRAAEAMRNSVFILLKRFRKALLDRGVTTAHARNTYIKCRRVLCKINAVTYHDATPTRIQQAVACMRDRRKAKPRPLLGAVSRNGYLSAIQAFAQWLRNEGYARENWLIGKLRKYKNTDPLRPRRILTQDELIRLFDVAERGPIHDGISGKERALIYRVCVVTGLRANEMRNLQCCDLALACDEPCVRVRASSAKNRREAFQPITPELADMLWRHTSGRQPTDPVFQIPHHTATMLRVDLDTAGIPYVEDGKYFDFHCLRYECGSIMVDKGVPLSVVQRLMRHSDLSMTSRYVRPHIASQQAAVKALASVALASPPAGEQSRQAIAG